MGRAKATLEVAGETFVGRLVRLFRELTPEVVVVVGAMGDLQVPGARTVRNPHWRLGQLSSLQTGLRALPSALPAAFFTPVDFPLVQPATVWALWRRFEQQQPLLVIPQCHDRRGHPVLASARVWEELLALAASDQARRVIHAHRAETAYVEVDDPGIYIDIDTPEDYARWVPAP